MFGEVTAFDSPRVMENSEVERHGRPPRQHPISVSASHFLSSSPFRDPGERSLISSIHLLNLSALYKDRDFSNLTQKLIPVFSGFTSPWELGTYL